MKIKCISGRGSYLWVLLLIALAFGGVVAEGADDPWTVTMSSGVITVTNSSISTYFEESPAWTLRWMRYQGSEILQNSGWMGSVLMAPQVSTPDVWLWYGTGHGGETVSAFEIIVDGTSHVFQAGTTLSGTEVVLHKTSTLGIFLSQESRVIFSASGDSFREDYTYGILPDFDPRFSFMYAFMHIHPNALSQWMTLGAGSEENEGTMVANDGNMRELGDVKSTTFYSPTLEKGVNYTYPTVYLGADTFKNSIWDRANDNKLYFRPEVRGLNLSVGETFGYWVDVTPFAASTSEWKDITRSLAGDCGPGFTNVHAASIEETSADLFATLIGTNADVKLFWDTEDHGQTFTWAHTNAFSNTIAGTTLSNHVALTPSTHCYFCFYATNTVSGKTSWSSVVDINNTGELIIDDEDAGWYGVKGWTDNVSGTPERGFNADYRYTPASDGQAVWRFVVAPNKEYTVAAHWFWYSTYAMNAHYVISGDIVGGSVTSSVINQRVEPVGDYVRTETIGSDSHNFQMIGVVTSGPNGRLVVTLEREGSAIMSADAILVTGGAYGSISADTIPIVDDQDASGVGFAGTWTLNNPLAYTYGDLYHYSTTAGNEVTWTNTVEAGATYVVCASWFANAVYDAAASYEISGVKGGPYNVSGDQTSVTGDYTLAKPESARNVMFQDLGEYVATGTEIIVKLTSSAGGNACADAVACLKTADAVVVSRATLIIIN